MSQATCLIRLLHQFCRAHSACYFVCVIAYRVSLVFPTIFLLAHYIELGESVREGLLSVSSKKLATGAHIHCRYMLIFVHVTVYATICGLGVVRLLGRRWPVHQLKICDFLTIFPTFMIYSIARENMFRFRPLVLVLNLSSAIEMKYVRSLGGKRFAYHHHLLIHGFISMLVRYELFYCLVLLLHLDLFQIFDWTLFAFIDFLNIVWSVIRIIFLVFLAF